MIRNALILISCVLVLLYIVTYIVLCTSEELNYKIHEYKNPDDEESIPFENPVKDIETRKGFASEYFIGNSSRNKSNQLEDYLL